MGVFSRIFRKNEQHEPILNDSLPNQTEKQIETEQTDESVQDYSTYTVYFTNGHLSKIDPYPNGGYYENRDIANNAHSIISDGVRYDLTSVKSIHSIRVPDYSLDFAGGIGVTGFLEYVLRMRSGNYWNERKFNLSIACLEKATELMRYSSMGWPPKDFFRIVNELNDLGKLKSALKWQRWIENNVPGAKAALSVSPEDRIEGITKEALKSKIASCKTLGTNLVEVGNIGFTEKVIYVMDNNEYSEIPC